MMYFFKNNRQKRIYKQLYICKEFNKVGEEAYNSFLSILEHGTNADWMLIEAFINQKIEEAHDRVKKQPTLH